MIAPGRRARVRAAVVAGGVALVVGGGLGLAAPAAAAEAAEVPPPDRACRYHDREVTSQRLDASAAAAATWPQERLRYQDAWAFSRGRGVTVAVVDSGVDAGHEQLRGAVREGYDVTSGRVARGGKTDCSAHGTMVAGIIAARPVSGRSFAGVAPEATILPIRQTWGLDANARELPGSADLLIRAMEVAVRSGAQVVNVSITVRANSLTDEQRRRFAQVAQVASDRSVVIVAATGNRAAYQNENVATYPAQLASWYGNVIAVSGTKPDGQPDEDAITGPFVTLTAPDREMPCLMDHGGLVPCFGTSFAAPFVAGAAALIRGRYPDDSAQEVRERLQATADHPARDLPDPVVGYGLVNPAAAVTTVIPDSKRAVPAPPVTARPPKAPGPSAAIAIAVATIAAGLSLVIALIPAAVRRGRRRRWRPGIRSATGEPIADVTPAAEVGRRKLSGSGAHRGG